MPEDSKISKAQQKAVQKYVKNNYDRIVLTLPKGKRDSIKKHAAEQGESMNAFINRAIDETMERDNFDVDAAFEEYTNSKHDAPTT